jgi:hypothetical protein
LLNHHTSSENYWKYLSRRKKLAQKQSRREGFEKGDGDGQEDWLDDLRHLQDKAKEVWETVDGTVSRVVDGAIDAAGQSAGKLFDMLNRGIQQLQFEL